jgi:hypothetical protein
LAQNIIAFCDAAGINAQHSKTYFQIPAAPAGLRMNFTVGPAAPFYALIMHRSSFGNILPGIWQFWSGHKHMVYHTGIITTDMIDSAALQWDVVTAQNQMFFGMQNNDVLPRDYEGYMWHINVLTETDLKMIQRAVCLMMIGQSAEQFRDEFPYLKRGRVPSASGGTPATVRSV